MKSSSPHDCKQFFRHNWRPRASVGTSGLWLGATRRRNRLCQRCPLQVRPRNHSLCSSRGQASQKFKVATSPSTCLPFILHNHNLMQTKQKGGQCRHLLGMTFPTRLRRGPQRHKRSREDPSGSSSAQSLLTRRRMADSREQRKGQN